MRGLIYSGVNNIYTLRGECGNFRECRIKGKILSDNENSYNPLAPGDQVEYLETEDGKGLISSRCERRNRFARWNRKKDCWQTVAANIDLLAIVASKNSPSFRPRFVDRVLINAAYWNIPAIVLINKNDLPGEAALDSRVSHWLKLNIPVLRCSAKSREGIEGLRQVFTGKTAALFGQSGAGKSSLVNVLIPGMNLPVGDVSAKHDRGRHVTNFGRLIDSPWNGRLVDTPGVREILIRGLSAAELPHCFPEIENAGKNCAYQSCSHTQEASCAVINALEQGEIHQDRYRNYLRIRMEIEEEKRHKYG